MQDKHVSIGHTTDFAEIAKDCTNSLLELYNKTQDEVNTALGKKKTLIQERADQIKQMIDKIEAMITGEGV